MKAVQSLLPEVMVLEPTVHGDDRGFFFESYREDYFANFVGKSYRFSQDNHSKSSHGVLRGLHYQIKNPQGKLVRVLQGSIFDVAVDIRQGSRQFGKWFGLTLSAENKKQLWIPPDFAHGFLVLSDTAEVLYKATDYYAPQHERSILWNDASIGIDWPVINGDPLLSAKDERATSLLEADLPTFKQ